MKKVTSALLHFSLLLLAFAANAAIYGTLNDETNLVVAPRTVVVDGCYRGVDTITEPQANALGYKLVVDEPPTCASNEYAVATGWEERAVEDGGQTTADNGERKMRIFRTYEKRTVVPPPRIYYRYDVSQACYENGFLDSLIQYIESDQYIKWFWNCSNKVEETNPLFIEATNKVIKAGVDEKLVKRILDRAYELGQTTGVGRD